MWWIAVVDTGRTGHNLNAGSDYEAKENGNYRWRYTQNIIFIAELNYLSLLDLSSMHLILIITQCFGYFLSVCLICVEFRKVTNDITAVIWYHWMWINDNFYSTQWTAGGSVLVPSVCGFLCVWNISGTAERICSKFTWKTCLVPRSDEFEGQGHQGQKRHFSALRRPACSFCLAKTSLVSFFLLNLFDNSV